MSDRRFEAAKDNMASLLRYGGFGLEQSGMPIYEAAAKHAVAAADALLSALGEQLEEPIDQAHWNKLLEASNEEWEAETTRLRGEIATLLQDKRDLRQLLHEILLLCDSALHSKGWIYINSSMRNNIESALAGEATT